MRFVPAPLFIGWRPPLSLVALKIQASSPWLRPSPSAGDLGPVVGVTSCGVPSVCSGTSRAYGTVTFDPRSLRASALTPAPSAVGGEEENAGEVKPPEFTLVGPLALPNAPPKKGSLPGVTREVGALMFLAYCNGTPRQRTA